MARTSLFIWDTLHKSREIQAGQGGVALLMFCRFLHGIFLPFLLDQSILFLSADKEIC